MVVIRPWRLVVPVFVALAALAVPALNASAQFRPDSAWVREFPKTDYEKHIIPYDEFQFDGATRDSIPPITDPQYAQVAEAAGGIGPQEPVLSFIKSRVISNIPVISGNRPKALPCPPS